MPGLVDGHRLPPEQVRDLDLADGRGVEASRDELLERGHGPRLEPQRRRGLDGAPDHVAGRGRDGDQQPAGRT